MEHVGKCLINFQERVKKMFEEKKRKVEELRKIKPAARICKDCGSEIEPYIDENHFVWKAENECRICQENEVKKQQQEEKEKRISNLLNESGLCGKLLKMTFNNFERSKCLDTYKIAKQYAEDFSPGITKGLIFQGRAGSGKTSLVAAIAHEIIEQKMIPIRFIEAFDLLLNIRKAYSTKTCEELDLIEKFSKCQLLVIDDLGTEKNTDWVQQIFYKIINDRYKLELPTIITTNLTLEELEKRLDERVTSRIVEMCKLVKMPDINYRLSYQKSKSKLVQLRIENNLDNSQSGEKRVVS